MIKPNTKYTLIFKFDANKKVSIPVSLKNGDSLSPITNQVTAINICSNIYIATLTTVSNFDNLIIAHQVVYFNNSFPWGLGDKCKYYNDMILLEGDYSKIPAEEFPKFFDGIKSSFENGIVDAKVKGKNLFDTSKLAIASNSDVGIVALKDKFLLYGFINRS